MLGIDEIQVDPFVCMFLCLFVFFIATFTRRVRGTHNEIDYEGVYLTDVMPQSPYSVCQAYVPEVLENFIEREFPCYDKIIFYREIPEVPDGEEGLTQEAVADTFPVR